MAIAVKISEENYRRLSVISGKLQEQLERPVSLNDAITYLYVKRQKLSKSAGKWKMDDKETEEIAKTLKKGWKGWNASA